MPQRFQGIGQGKGGHLTLIERTVFDGFQTLVQSQRFQIAATIERILPDYLHTTRDVNLLKLITMIEGISFNFLEILRKRDLYELVTLIECLSANGLDTIVQGHSRQFRTTTEGARTNTCHLIFFLCISYLNSHLARDDNMSRILFTAIDIGRDLHLVCHIVVYLAIGVVIDDELGGEPRNLIGTYI